MKKDNTLIEKCLVKRWIEKNNNKLMKPERLSQWILYHVPHIEIILQWRNIKQVNWIENKQEKKNDRKENSKIQ